MTKKNKTKEPKIKEYKTKGEKVKIVVDIAKKLSNFPRSDNPELSINLYNDVYEPISELKEIFKRYIEQKQSISGKLDFPEINKVIEYILPVGKHIDPLFVLRQPLKKF